MTSNHKTDIYNNVTSRSKTKKSKFKFRKIASQLKAVFLLSLYGHVSIKDSIKLFLLAIGLINRIIKVNPWHYNGHSVHIRPMTTDLRTLKDTLCNKYHLPHLEKAETILDLGANVGYVASDLAIKFPSAQILSVELDVDNYNMLIKNTSGLGIRVLHAGVWTHEDGITYDATRSEDAFAAIPTKIPTVRSVCMNTLIAQLGGWVDYVKMDIEGGEKELITEDAYWIDDVGHLKVELHVSPDDCEKMAYVLQNHGMIVTRDNQHVNTFSAIRKIHMERTGKDSL